MRSPAEIPYRRRLRDRAARCRRTGVVRCPTCDQEEALEVANRVVVMDKGRIEQVGTPAEVYDSPASAFVHGFIGELIELPVQVADGGVQLGGEKLSLAADGVRSGHFKAVRPSPRHADRPGRRRRLSGRDHACPQFRSCPARRSRAVARKNRDRDRCAPRPGTEGRRGRRPQSPSLPDICRINLRHSGMMRRHQTPDAQLRIGESRHFAGAQLRTIKFCPVHLSATVGMQQRPLIGG